MVRTRVLVVDDETLLRTLLVQRLALEADLEVVGEGTNGREAVELAGRLRPDIVLMDLSMPVLDGAQATERIVARYPHVKVVLLTGLKELAHVGKPWGAFDCLSKGCNLADVVQTIRRAHRARQEAVSAADVAEGYGATIQRLALRLGLTERESRAVQRAMTPDLTVAQIAASLSAESGEPITVSGVKHALERAMTKLRIEPRTRAALVKRVIAAHQGG